MNVESLTVVFRLWADAVVKSQEIESGEKGWRVVG